ncbi:MULTISPECIES: adenylate kinase [Borrelia]|uniref:Adenylate kinase n=2 Tax=Borrelia turicatae TaxID=142 RepID=KAD_BORT9|nr:MULTISPECIES: adenylate kinase [Borrelia]A1QZK3.1 RecName: Full=Adenylate kinase; Short=AK; AltName: Full=ATP-AMP transphosphorylase; AltName: Full=ATP:AMP phosphotransferase; AltName: Full=Adenylate monophosphate kinase [Borrelia turicatae 91E135]AAX17745.1 adenylate kinase [Borrelia turicatae 91E135]ABC86782.1 adenylate kinase [Borrelia turicatae]ANF33890.1 adenylate kinase [Borrelia turicatae]UPA12087.1 adenylate kinase [Borrelia venezuelensis]UPA13260.1 adenylate kinase [Borrelia turic
MKLVFLGPPGSGKGTIAKILSGKLNYYHISTGDLFRANISNATPLGKEIKQIVENGQLVPDSITIKIVEDKINTLANKDNFILDGFPRNINQAKALDTFLQNIQIINFLLDEAILIKRLSGRRICQSCGGIFNIYTLPTKEKGICDLCKGSLYQRKDDVEESLKIRLQEYHLQTKPLIDFYSKNNRLNNINASKDIDGVEKSLIEIISKY